MHEVFRLETDYIKLGQLLKASGVAESGMFAKIMIQNGDIYVNDIKAMERGKKIRVGDFVRVMDAENIYATIEVIA